MEFNITEVISGAAKGIDHSGENWAEFQRISVKRFKPNWDKLGKAAGPIRNLEMAEYGDALLIIHNGSPGSASMIYEMKRLNKPIYEVKLRKLC